MIFAHPSVYVCFKELFDLCINHGYFPSIMRTGIILPNLKEKSGDEKGVKNYRPITIISILVKSWKHAYLTDLGASWFLMICGLVTKKNVVVMYLYLL